MLRNAFRTLEFKIFRLFLKIKWWLTSRTTQNTTSKHKNFTIFPLILREIDAEKTRSGLWNLKFWGYLWRTSDGSHLEIHKTRLRKTKISQFLLLSSEKEMLRKRVQDVGIQNFEVIYEEQMMDHIQKHNKTRLRNIKMSPYSSYPQRKRCWENAFRTLEFKILGLFLKNKWLLSSSTTQNTPSKHKHFTIFPLIYRERDAEKTHSGRWNSNLWGYLWRTSDGSHPEPHKTRLRNIKISPFFLLSSEKEMLRKRVQDVRIQTFWGYLWRTNDGPHPEPHKTRLGNIKSSPFFLLSLEKEILRKRVQDVGIQNFEVIYEEKVMDHIQNNTKHDFET
jgi:hypothetical protein